MNEDSDPDGYSRQLCLQLLSWGKRKIVMKSMRDIANLTTTCSIRNNIITQCNAAAAPAGRTGSADRGRVPGRPGTVPRARIVAEQLFLWILTVKTAICTLAQAKYPPRT